MTEKWEYLVSQPSKDHSLEVWLDELGAQGWRLILVLDERFIFLRPLYLP